MLLQGYCYRKLSFNVNMPCTLTPPLLPIFRGAKNLGKGGAVDVDLFRISNYLL